ncbi:hypothetical protein ANANG_G00293780 [Anguilla anguilla]|uniref:Sterile alpha motif domain-containing protein 9-like n=1 Tax=Anguilla anguilla TaxID=7936 RepID=A0A9D3LLZ7_ANGAN|nr:hypothetical protein ANANG_G00293780 [Anguilla anguilla]
METGKYVPNSEQGNTYLDTTLLDSLPCLEILYANECETLSVCDDVATNTEAYFYRGGQVQWLNFYLAEKRAGLGGPLMSSFITRDGHASVAIEVKRQRQSHLSLSSVNLFHEPGSGGTTLAMQVLWDFRKSLRCAVLRDSEAKIQEIARQIIALFQAGGPKNQNTVLLLIDNLPMADILQSSLVQCIASSRVDGNIPVVIILNCVRSDCQDKADITCRMELSDGEKDQFIEKEASVRLSHGQNCEGFHGFNIMGNNFSEEYVKKVVSPILNDVQPSAKNTKLLSVLALLNSYAPGSSLLKSECQAFLGPPDPIHGGPSFEDRMEPFTGLLVTFSRRKNLVSQDFVRMAHPLIATYCCQALQAAGLTLGQTTKTLIKDFDKEQRGRPLPLTIHALLVNRTTGKQFSPLIEDLGNRKPLDCEFILESVYKKYLPNAFVLQVLARFLYLKKQDYSKAEKWARQAKRLLPNNSFIADTLGQLHKHHLQKNKPDSLCLQLELVKKAVAAFEEQWKVAEGEDEARSEDAGGTTRKSFFFNCSGLLGFMQVARFVVIDMRICLSSQETKEMVMMLTAKVDLQCCMVPSKTLWKFKSLLTGFKDKVESTFSFFERFLTYSERDRDLSYTRDNVTSCYVAFAFIENEFGGKGTDGIRGELKKKTAASFPGLLHCLEMNKTTEEITKITKMWKEVVHPPSPSGPLSDTLCYLLSNIALSCVDPESEDILPFTNLTSILHSLLKEEHGPDHETELYFLALVLLWPGNSESIPTRVEGQQNRNPGEDDSNLNIYVTRLQKAYEKCYHRYLRSRYIRPHFFLREGTEYGRLVHWSTVKRWVTASAKYDTQESRAFHLWINEAVWENAQLLRVQGIIKDRKMFACVGQREVLVHPDNVAQVRSPGRVSFYLGFNIRGPVAFDIQYSSGPVQPPS